VAKLKIFQVKEKKIKKITKNGFMMEGKLGIFIIKHI